MTQVQNNPKGILFILLGMATFSIQDALIKFIYEDSALYELYFGRTFVALVLLVGYLKYSKQKINLITHYPFLTILNSSLKPVNHSYLTKINFNFKKNMIYKVLSLDALFSLWQLMITVQ